MAQNVPPSPCFLSGYLQFCKDCLHLKQQCRKCKNTGHLERQCDHVRNYRFNPIHRSASRKLLYFVSSRNLTAYWGMKLTLTVYRFSLTFTPGRKSISLTKIISNTLVLLVLRNVTKWHSCTDGYIPRKIKNSVQTSQPLD